MRDEPKERLLGRLCFPCRLLFRKTRLFIDLGQFPHSVGRENLSILIGKSQALFVPFQCSFYKIY